MVYGNIKGIALPNNTTAATSIAPRIWIILSVMGGSVGIKGFFAITFWLSSQHALTHHLA